MKSSKVEDYFITPLEAHFESQPTEGGRETIINDLSEYAPEDLETAVEWLKRARQSVKTFPSPKECIKSIKAVVGGRTERAVIRGEVISADNYAANAIAYCAGMREVPIIKEGSPQWEEWLQYWQWLGATWVLDLVRDRKTWTVPAEFPGVFDRRFTATNPARKAA